MDDSYAERARQRATWPGRVADHQDPAQLATARERVASMWQLALDGMAARGEPMPEYDRATMPGRVFSVR